MSFAKEMLAAADQLKPAGHFCYLPEETEKYLDNSIHLASSEVGAQRKIENDFINKHYEKIKKADAILVLNYDKRGVTNYIGGNTFLEMGFAHVLKRKIYLLNQIPEMNFMKQEIIAMQPIILNGVLSLI